MSSLDFRHSRAYQAFSAYAILASRAFRFLFLLLTLATCLIYVLGGSSSQAVIGVSILLSGIVLAGWLLHIFARTYLPAAAYEPRFRDQENIADWCSFSVLNMLASAHRDPSPSRRLLSDLLTAPEISILLNRVQIPADRLAVSLSDEILTQLSFTEWIESAFQLSQSAPNHLIQPEHLLAALLLHPAARTLVRHYDLQENDIKFLVWWLVAHRFAQANARRWWDPDRLLAFSGIGLSWVSGFTPLVDQYSRIPRGNLWDDILVGRLKYVDQLITTLARQRQSNVLLVGQAGVGRIGIIQELSRRIRASQAHPALDGQKVVYLHVGEIIALGNSSASQLAVLNTVLNEMERAGNIIAVIDGLSSVLSQAGDSTTDMSEILLPFFSSRTVRVVVLVSREDYHLRLKDNQELLHFFETVQIHELSPEDTLKTLALAAPSLESETGIYLPYQTLHALVEGTADIMPDIPFPERAFDVLEEAIVQAQANRRRQILVSDIEALLSQKTGIPFGQIQSSEAERLLNLEDIMHQRLINQNQAVKAIARAMVRARANIRNPHRPVGTFLFLGPTGVGKTETAKTLADAYFGSADYVIRFDMSEFQTEEGIAQLIGSHVNPVGRLTSAIADHPFAVILLDEFEKAHPSIHQLFLQVLDEGRLTDARGHTFSFKHTIVIATSNAGSEMIRQEVTDGQVPPDFARRLTEFILSQQIFRPELLNRFDEVVTFIPLTPEHIREVARLMLNKLNRRLDDRHGVTLEVSDELLDFLVARGYDPEFGARPMNRLIQDTLEYAIARRILKDALHPGDTIRFSAAELGQTIEANS